MTRNATMTKCATTEYAPSYEEKHEEAERMAHWFETAPWWELTNTVSFWGCGEKDTLRMQYIKDVCHSWGYYLHKVSGFSGLRTVTKPYESGLRKDDTGLVFIGVDCHDTAGIQLFTHIANLRNGVSGAGEHIYVFEDSDDAKSAFDALLCDLGCDQQGLRSELLARLEE